MRRSCITLCIVLIGLGLAPPAQASDQAWSPPVDGRVERGYEPPTKPFGPRHLGIDFEGRPNTPVRAAGDGVVEFAGHVGRSRAVGIDHPGGRRTTYAYLQRVVVRPGAAVRRGDVVGFSGGHGPGHGPAVVHFGYRVNGRPQDPGPLFQPPRPRISLAPVDAPACRYTGR